MPIAPCAIRIAMKATMRATSTIKRCRRLRSNMPDCQNGKLSVARRNKSRLRAVREPVKWRWQTNSSRCLRPRMICSRVSHSQYRQTGRSSLDSAEGGRRDQYDRLWSDRRRALDPDLVLGRQTHLFGALLGPRAIISPDLERPDRDYRASSISGSIGSTITVDPPRAGRRG